MPVFFRHEFGSPESIPAVRTLDADFLIPNQRKLQSEMDVPSALRNLGFVATFNRSSRLVVYDHPQLRVEFLTPEVGKGFEKPHDIKKLHIKAVGLRYLNLLADYPRQINYGDIKLKVPEPGVFAVHKLIISARRKKADKKGRDVEAAIGILDWIFGQPDELKKLNTVLKSLPKKWLGNIRLVSKSEYPRLADEIDGLRYSP